jgi:hypothetical protein
MEERLPDNTSRGGANLILGAILIGLGLLFLVVQIPGVRFGYHMWPFFIIIPGLAFFVGMVLGGRGAGGLAVPGSIVTTVGLILLYQNVTNHWVSWSYAWGLIVAAVGIGLMINGSWSFRPALITQGRRVAVIGLALFLAFGAFFEAFIFRGFIGYAQWVWPVALIALGLFLLLRRGRDSF